MGAISIENTERLFWLGRYSERVFTTVKAFTGSYDAMIDFNEEGYKDFCATLEIPMVYSDRNDFLSRYMFSLEDPNSLYSNLSRAYDNAIVLREEIGSESLSHVQMAMYAMAKAEKSDAPLLEIQEVLDHIVAFWGTFDDIVEDEEVRSLIKLGKRVERIDLYSRFRMPSSALEREVHRLKGRIQKVSIPYNQFFLEEMEIMASMPFIDYQGLLFRIDNLFVS